MRLEKNVKLISMAALLTALAGCVIMPPGQVPPSQQPPANCTGTWTTWSRVADTETACSAGSRTYQETRSFAVTAEPTTGGTACPASPEYRQATEACTIPLPDPPIAVNCTGAWTNWSRLPATDGECIAGTRSFTETRAFSVSTPAAHGGTACPASPETRTSSETCTPPPPAPVDCTGTWGSWSRISGSETACGAQGQRTFQETRAYAISTPAAHGGAACPVSPETRTSTEACTPPPVVVPPLLGSIVLAVEAPRENEDGTALRLPLTWQMSLNDGAVQTATYVDGKVALSPVNPGTYQVRVRVKDADGEISAWSTAVPATVQTTGGTVTTTTTYTPVHQNASTGDPVELTFARPTGTSGELYHTVFFAVGKEGTGTFDAANITYDGSTAPVKAVPNSDKSEENNRIAWYYVENVTSGNHTISVPTLAGDNVIRKGIAAFVRSSGKAIRAVAAQTTSITNATTVTNSNIPVLPGDVVASAGHNAEVYTHTWGGGATEFADITGLSEALTAATQVVGEGVTTVSPSITSSSSTARLAMSSIVIREMEGSAILKGRTWSKKANNNPGDRDLTALGTLDWRYYGTYLFGYTTNVHWKGAASGTPGTAPTGWTFNQSGGTLTVGDSGLAQGTGVKTLQFAATAARHVITDTTLNLTTGATYYAFVRATVNSGTISIQNILKPFTGTATVTLTGWKIDGVTAVATDNVTGSNKLLMVSFTINATGNIALRYGVGVTGSSTADVTLERPLLTRGIEDHSNWPVTGDRKSGGSLINTIEHASTNETTMFSQTTGDSANNPATSWTNGTVEASHSAERDITYLDPTSTGWGWKVTTAALNHKRIRFVVGYSVYQADLTFEASVSDSSSSAYQFTYNTGVGDVSSFETSVVIEAPDANATVTFKLTASDTDGNVTLQYIYAEEWPYEIVVEDTFTGSDNTAIENRTPSPTSLLSAAPNGEGAVTGNTYNGGIDIVSNAMKCLNNGEVIEYVINSPDAIVELDWVISASTGHRMHFGVGRVSKDNHFYYNLREQNADWNLYRRDAGVQASIVSSQPKTWGLSKTYQINIRRVGDNMKLMADGDTLHTYSSATQHKDADRIAIGVAELDTPASVDNLVIWRPINPQPALSGLIIGGTPLSSLIQ